MKIEDNGKYFLETIEYSKPFSGKCTFRKINDELSRLNPTRVIFEADFSLFINSHIRNLTKQNVELKSQLDEECSRISLVVSQEIKQCASWTSEIQERDELLRIFTKSMTAASKTWFPKEMIETKAKVEKLLEK